MPFTLKESQTTASTLRRIDSGAGVNGLGTFVTPTSSFTLTQLEILVRRENNPTANLYTAICADTSGVPGSVLATTTTPVASNTLANANASDPAAWAAFPFTGLALTNGTGVWIIAYGDGSGDGFGGAAVQWYINTSVPGAARAERNGASWGSATGEQFDFKMYETAGGGGATIGDQNLRATRRGSLLGMGRGRSLSPMLSLSAYYRERERAQREFMAKVRRAA